MKSILKTKLEREQIENLINIHFPGEELLEITELPDGNICSVYILHMDAKDRPSIVLKVGMKKDVDYLRYEKDLFPTEVKVYRLLEDKNVPIPEVLKADLSCEIVPAGYFFMNFVEGRTWMKAGKELDTANRRRLLKKLGEYHARISSIRGDYFGYLKEGEHHHFQTHSEAFFNMIQDILMDGKERKVQLPYEEIEKTVQACRGCLDEVKEPRLVDFDLWAGNVFLNEKETIEISGIIDFGHCFYGDPYAGFASAVHLYDDVEKEPDFIEGYESVSGEKISFTENFRTRMDLYRLYMALLCAVETYRYEESWGNKARASHLRRIEALIKKINT